MLEKQIQTKIIKYLESINSVVIKTINTNKAGVSDLIVCYKGKFIAIEIKAKNGKVSKLQEVFIKKIINAGGYGFVAYSIDDVKKEFKNII